MSSILFKIPTDRALSNEDKFEKELFTKRLITKVEAEYFQNPGFTVMELLLSLHPEKYG